MFKVGNSETQTTAELSSQGKWYLPARLNRSINLTVFSQILNQRAGMVNPLSPAHTTHIASCPSMSHTTPLSLERSSLRAFEISWDRVRFHFAAGYTQSRWHARLYLGALKRLRHIIQSAAAPLRRATSNASNNDRLVSVYLGITLDLIKSPLG